MFIPRRAAAHAHVERQIFIEKFSNLLMCLSELLGVPSKDVQVSIGLEGIATYTIRSDDYTTAEQKMNLKNATSFANDLNKKMSGLNITVSGVKIPETIDSKISGNLNYKFLIT